jgi:hypothetical protein
MYKEDFALGTLEKLLFFFSSLPVSKPTIAMEIRMDAWADSVPTAENFGQTEIFTI